MDGAQATHQGYPWHYHVKLGLVFIVIGVVVALLVHDAFLAPLVGVAMCINGLVIRQRRGSGALVDENSAENVRGFGPAPKELSYAELIAERPGTPTPA